MFLRWMRRCRPGLLLLAAAVGATACGQEPNRPAQTLLEPHGGANAFPVHYRRALNTLINAEVAYYEGDYAKASNLLNRLWADFPPGSDAWKSATNQAVTDSGLNIGSPPCYYALRMLTECCDWKLQGREPQATTNINWSVVLVGHIEGRQPQNDRQRAQGAGPVVTKDLLPDIQVDEAFVIRQAIRLFREYITAITEGRVVITMRYLPMDRLTVPGIVNAAPNTVAGIDGPGYGQIWNAVVSDVKATTDWWWIIYPSFVPEQFPDFATTEFVTGGMGVGPDGQSPCFIIDDRWLTRKPPHLGKGEMHQLERRAYLPQWLQHEFFHHLFARYPEFRLETERGHDWFDRSAWPADFEGQFEADYYAEALHKRLQRADTPLHVALQYQGAPATAPTQDLSGIVTPGMLTARYRAATYENEWHEGEIRQEDGDKARFRWTNKAGASWLLTPDLKNGVLLTGEDCPYFNDPGGKQFVIEMDPSRSGKRSRVTGFRFNGDSFLQQGERD